MRPPALYYGVVLMADSMEPQFYLRHVRRWTAAGAPGVVAWDFLYSTKLKGEQIEPARRKVRQVVQDYRCVKDRMVYCFVYTDGSGHTWINDRDKSKAVRPLKDPELPNGRSGRAGNVYVVEETLAHKMRQAYERRFDNVDEQDLESVRKASGFRGIAGDHQQSDAWRLPTVAGGAPGS